MLRLGVDPGRVDVIHNGVAPAGCGDYDEGGLRSARRKLRDELGLAADAQIVLLPARLTPNKRHDVAIDTVTALASRGGEVHLLLVGDRDPGGPRLPDVLREQARRRRVTLRVHFLGFREDMDRLYAAADVLLLPSEDEPFGLVILEAMAAGVPVVASRSGGIPEIVEHGKSGRLVEPGDVDGFASALREVLTQRELRDSLVEEGRKLVEGHFSLKRFVDEVVEVYDEVLGLRPGVSADAASGNGTASSRSSTAGPPQ